MRHAREWLVAVAALGVLPAGVQAQVRASEHAVVAQTVDGTTLTVEYSRPQARGRSPIFGKVIPWGEVWTPGANWATTLEVDNDITLNGHPLAKGKYSVWIEVQPKEWTVILDPKSHVFHTEHPKPDSTQVRFGVTPDDGKGPDLLTWSFSDISATGTSLRMAWAGRSVSLRITVPPSHPITLAAELAARYVGAYAFQWASRDTTEAQADSAQVKASVWQVTYREGMLLADWVPPPFEEWAHLVLIRIADNWFLPGAMVDGQLFDVEGDLVIEFAVVNGRATGFEIRGEDDEVIGRGTRTK